MDPKTTDSGIAVATIQNEPYFYEPMSRSQLAELLQCPGDFLVHVSTKQGAVNIKTHERILGHIYILSVMCNGNKIRHWLIKEEQGKFGIECVTFPSIQMMLQHYVESGESVIQGESVFLSKPIVRADTITTKEFDNRVKEENILEPLNANDQAKVLLSECTSQCSALSSVEDLPCNKTPESSCSETPLDSPLCSSLSTAESDESSKCDCGNFWSDSSHTSHGNCTQESNDSDRDIALIDQWFRTVDTSAQTSFKESSLSPADLVLTQTDSHASPVKKQAVVNADFPHIHLSAYTDGNDDVIRASAINATNFFEFVDVYGSKTRKDASQSTLSKIFLAAEALFAEYKQLVASLSVDKCQDKSRA